MPGLTAHDRELWPKHPPLLTVDTVDAFLAAAQMNVVEFHTWNSTVRRLDKPDRVIFDLDPGEDVIRSKVHEAALLARTLLTELGLKAWLNSSGGKGRTSNATAVAQGTRLLPLGNGRIRQSSLQVTIRFCRASTIS
ncbi:bifunctional non-homologous end joining protein LigD [Paraburkholderia steynii]|uniref:Bifunctional non-homologous end joining protein LigD n=1 Tax=Paraburkholderia steynii TaxID=1245441 RepID=A0A7Z7FIZ3_9BURK|nr:bifunctional non-homologous end joining protein LigD [Paraburkholderia steynii]